MQSDEDQLYNVDDHEVAELDTASTSNSCTISTEPGSSSAFNEWKKRRIFLLEPAVFLIFLAKNLTSTVFQNQMLYQACIGVYNYNASDCEPLLGINEKTEESQIIEDFIQPYVSHILMVRSVIEGIVPALLSLFIGSWSDKFGRRPIILTTFAASLASMSLVTILNLVSIKVPFNPWIFLLPSIPLILSGGLCAMITGVYSYISDVTDPQSKAKRMIFNDASLGAGTIVGGLISGYIYAATNVPIVFCISTAVMALAFTYVYFFALESANSDLMTAKIWLKLREFFRLNLVKDLVSTCCKRRPRYDRAIIWMTMFSLTLIICTGEGESNVNYFFLRKKFDWTLNDYSLFNAERAIIQVIGCVVCLILFRKVWKISIVTMALIACACCVLESTVRATVKYSWELYLGVVLGLLGGIISSMSRAILSQVAPSNEVGKIFALTISMETISPLGAAPLYTMVYDSTLQYYPGAYNFISAGFNLICYSLNAIILSLKLSIVDYQVMGL